jgi:S1-C subfamily serine protease
MQRSALALGMMLSCAIGMWGARLPADEPAPAPAAKTPSETKSEEGRRRWEQAFAHQLDMLRDQQARRRVPPQARNHEAILEAFRESVLPVRLGTVIVLDGDEQVALGTVVDREGLVFTKASELRGTPAIRLADGTRHVAEVVAVSEDHDLALLKIGRTDLEPV